MKTTKNTTKTQAAKAIKNRKAAANLSAAIDAKAADMIQTPEGLKAERALRTAQVEGKVKAAEARKAAAAAAGKVNVVDALIMHAAGKVTMPLSGLVVNTTPDKPAKPAKAAKAEKPAKELSLRLYAKGEFFFPKLAAEKLGDAKFIQAETQGKLVKLTPCAKASALTTPIMYCHAAPVLRIAKVLAVTNWSKATQNVPVTMVGSSLQAEIS